MTIHRAHLVIDEGAGGLNFGSLAEAWNADPSLSAQAKAGPLDAGSSRTYEPSLVAQGAVTFVAITAAGVTSNLILDGLRTLFKRLGRRESDITVETVEIKPGEILIRLRPNPSKPDPEKS